MHFISQSNILIINFIIITYYKPTYLFQINKYHINITINNNTLDMYK